MRLEICIKADYTVERELLAGLSELVPKKHTLEASCKFHTDSYVQRFIIETACPDGLLQSITAVMQEIENRYPLEELLDIHVRNIDCSEPTWCSAEYGKPFSPVDGFRLVPWNSGNDFSPGSSDIILDPAQAFGTGIHPSTRLCLQFLKQAADGMAAKKLASSAVLDIGCGSGILAIAALKLGAARVLAVDIDPAAIQVARRNIQLNRLAPSALVMEASWQDLTGQHGLILANLVPSVLLKAASHIVKLLRQEGLFITAGFPASKNKKIQELFELKGLHLVSESSLDEWGALLLTKL